jgi:hypothetical protein
MMDPVEVHICGEPAGQAALVICGLVMVFIASAGIAVILCEVWGLCLRLWKMWRKK